LHAAQVNLWLAPSTPPDHFPDAYVDGTIVNPSGANNSYWRSDVINSDGSAFQVEARGYTTANSDGTGAFTQRAVYDFGGLNGIGVCDDRSSGSVDPCISPNHSIDNNGRDNVVVFDFGVDGDGNDNVFAPVFFSIGWTNNSTCTASGSPGNGSCPDIEAWIGDEWPIGDLAAIEASSEWTKILSADPDNNIQVSTAADEHYYLFGPGQGRYLVIMAEQGSSDDYFKLQSLGIEQRLPPSEIPSPSSLPLLALGSMFALLFIRRVRRD
jgi:hypothetical protein